jgi:outer membrane protein insertion porin family
MNFRWDNGLRVVLLLMLFSGWARCAQQPSSPQSATQASLIVREVRIVKKDGTVLPTKPGITVEVEEPLNRGAVAESIRNLYKTGDFANIAVQEVARDDGIRLDFVVDENLFINRIVVLGLKPPPTEASAAGSMQLNLGQTYRENDVQDALARLTDTLHEEGLYQAKITVDRQAHPETHQLDILVHVVSGPRVRLGKIQLLNNTEYTDGDLLKLFKLKPGSQLTVARVQSAMERIRKFMQKKDHLSAGVSVRRGTYEEASNLLPLTLEVNGGPTVRLSVQGAKFSKGDLKKLIPVFQEASVDTDLLEEGKRNLRERLEREGYPPG